MNIIFYPKIVLPVGAVAPDSFDQSLGLYPHDSFVISRHRDGSVASTFGDLYWNLSAYDAEEKPSNLYFAYWASGNITQAREKLSRETRFLMFTLIWKRDGNPLSNGTLKNYLSVINAMAQYAEDTKDDIQNILCDEKRLLTFIDTSCSEWMTETLGSLLSLLAKMGRIQIGFDLVGDKLLKEIRSCGRHYRAKLKQFAPIPTRIYSTILSQLAQELSDWENVATDILPLVTACGKDPMLGRAIPRQKQISEKLGLQWELRQTFEESASQACLDYLRDKSHLLSVRGVSTAIAEIQAVAKLTIQAFTGMRDDEAASLPYQCLEPTRSKGKTHYIVLGRTTKLNGGKIKRTRWVTNKEGFRAICLAQQIADAIYAVFNIDPQKSKNRTNGRPLFVSISYLRLAGSSLSSKGEIFRPGDLTLDHLAKLRKRIEPIIEDVDLRELEQIDPHRAWRSERHFQIGQPWRFTTHQLRRSLALYAQRSGLVSLPSLRRQLQHITEEMSRYYAKGSAFAKNFIDHDKNHFGVEWQDAQSESAALSYVLNVLLSSDVLFGGHANWVEHRLKDTDGVVLIDRETTLRRFKKGEMAYRETPLGGCTNVGECDQPIIKWLGVECLSTGCRNMVCNLGKLERVINSQTRMVNALDPNSVEYRTEKLDLDVLIATREQILQQRNHDLQ